MTLPKTNPICQINGLRQSGHQLRPPDETASPPGAASALRGAPIITSKAIATSGMLQTARPARQEPSTSGRTTGIISMTGIVSPISNPLLYTAAPKVIRRGSHIRTSGGRAGCMIAIPAPITMVAA